MYAEIYSHEAEGIQCVFDNKKWVVCIKNWKPNNDAAQIEYLEIHHETDEQFILVEGKALLLAASRSARGFDIQVIPMERGKVYNVPQETWFNTITRRDTKLVYVQDAGTTGDNSEYQNMTAEELEYVRQRAGELL